MFNGMEYGDTVFVREIQFTGATRVDVMRYYAGDLGAEGLHINWGNQLMIEIAREW